MSDGEPRWRAGSAAATLPIAVGTPLGGYMARTSPATGTHDPLQIGVLHLEAGTRSLTLVTADVIGVDADLRDRIATSAGMPPLTVMLAASHTHSGPEGIVRRLHPIEPDAGDETLRQRFVQIASDGVRQARSTCEPVSLSFAIADASGAWSNRNDRTAPNDPRLRLLMTRREDTTLQTIVALTPVHPTVLGAESTVVSADLSGGIRRQIATLPDASGTTILSPTGAAGDVSTRFVRQAPTPAEIDRLAAIATRNAGDAIRAATPIAISADSLRHNHASIRLPSFREDLDPDPAQARVEAREAMNRAEADQSDPATLRQAITRYQGAYLRWQMAQNPSIAGDTAIDLDLWLLDDETVLVALPVELFTTLGQRIERASPFPVTLIVGYANGYAGYVADTDAWDAATYEALASPYARRAGDALVAAVIGRLQSLHAERTPSARP
ncbi:MAG: hypothetical protein WBA46_12575 [Thermomicrobiales bacterium]